MYLWFHSFYIDTCTRVQNKPFTQKYQVGKTIKNECDKIYMIRPSFKKHYMYVYDLKALKGVRCHSYMYVMLADHILLCRRIWGNTIKGQ